VLETNSYGMKKFIAVILIWNLNASFGQNLVPNSGFENLVSCPSNDGQIVKALPWYNPNANTPDLFNNCATSSMAWVPTNFAGTQSAHDGFGYSGVTTYYGDPNSRDYIGVQLNSPLAAGVLYYVEFFVSLAEVSSHSSDGIGVYLSSTKPMSSTLYNLPYSPQIKQIDGVTIDSDSTWTKISGTFTASGGEEYITIGNFYPDSLTTTSVINQPGTWAYYYIDDVTVIADSLVAVNKEPNVEIGFYPNPIKDNLSISGLKGPTELSLYSLHGDLLQNFSINDGDLLNMSSLQPGYYLINLQNKTQHFVTRVVKIE
jgi:hypothetical protein